MSLCVWIFNVDPCPFSKNPTELELDEQLTLYPLSQLMPATCIQSFLIPLHLAFLTIFSACYTVPTSVSVYMYTQYTFTCW